MSKLSLSLILLMAARAGAAIVNVPAGGDLQGALNAAQAGDTINLAAGATYTGNFHLAPNAGPAWITVQSSAIGSLPGPGSRVSPDQAAAMPKIVTPNSASALQITAGANYYHFIGIEFFAAPGIYIQDVIQVGNGTESSVDQLPHDIDFDRDYIHSDFPSGGKRGIALNGGSTTIQNCYISGLWSTWQDTQALAGWNGPGPYTITNNYLEAGTEIVAFGGAVPNIGGVVPSNILIKNNLFYKPLSWMPGNPSYAGIPVWVKNDIEFKNAQNVTIDSNTFENNWKGADQRGFFLLFNVRTELGQVPWAVVNDVKVINNVFRHSACGIDITGHDDDGSGSSSNFLIQNNVWDDISGNWGSDGRWFQATGGANNITIDHNTVQQGGSIISAYGEPAKTFSFTNNIVQFNSYGITCFIQGNSPCGSFKYCNCFPQITLRGNVIADNANASSGFSVTDFFPPRNFIVPSYQRMGFVDYLKDDWRLQPTSPYRKRAADGRDPGVDFEALDSSGVNLAAGGKPLQ